jgi:hypothetical protein
MAGFFYSLFIGSFLHSRTKWAPLQKKTPQGMLQCSCPWCNWAARSHWLAWAMGWLPFRQARPTLKCRYGTKFCVLLLSNWKVSPSPSTVLLAMAAFSNLMVLKFLVWWGCFFLGATKVLWAPCIFWGCLFFHRRSFEPLVFFGVASFFVGGLLSPLYFLRLSIFR